MALQGKLELCGLEVSCVIGDRADERAREQVLTLDVSLGLDIAAVAASDALEDTVDYVALAEGIRAALKAGRFAMIETAAARAAAVCMEHPKVLGASVRVEKSGAVQGLRSAAATAAAQRANEESPGAQGFRPATSN
jgi:dihydroneopterin aldolase